jgi:chemotaxis protein methyltransferase CheR
MRWGGFRKVRRQVAKRLRRRVSELGLSDLAAYGAHLEQHPDEWAVLDTLTHITISRFNRDQGIFAFLEREVLPKLATAVIARGDDGVQAWSVGCASGEEAYTLAIMWLLELAPRFPRVAIRILASDIDEAMLARARRGCFTAGSLKELPEHSRAAAFVRRDHRDCLRDAFKKPVRIVRHDIRSPAPAGPFDLVLCRNLAFTYFDLELSAPPRPSSPAPCTPEERSSSAPTRRCRRASTTSSRGAQPSGSTSSGLRRFNAGTMVVDHRRMRLAVTPGDRSCAS